MPQSRSSLSSSAHLFSWNHPNHHRRHQKHPSLAWSTNFLYSDRNSDDDESRKQERIIICVFPSHWLEQQLPTASNLVTENEDEDDEDGGRTPQSEMETILPSERTRDPKETASCSRKEDCSSSSSPSSSSSASCCSSLRSLSLMGGYRRCCCCLSCCHFQLQEAHRCRSFAKFVWAVHNQHKPYNGAVFLLAGK